jgi:hypothetical protein
MNGLRTPWRDRGHPPVWCAAKIGTVAFLRMAATELLHIAERTPDIARELQRLAEDLMDEAADMEWRG